MLNFPLLDFAFHTDGYFEEFAKDFARPEQSMKMNLIWFVWMFPKSLRENFFFFFFPVSVSSSPFRINNFYCLHISPGMQL